MMMSVLDAKGSRPRKYYIREFKRKKKERAVSYLGGSCLDCKGTFPAAVYDFHHLNPKDKEGKLSAMLSNNKWEDVVGELDKCVLLCSNCHRIRHIKEDTE